MNNYAITTAQLAEAVQRSAGAANTYGASLERTIGYVTSIGEVTRESGSVIGYHLNKPSNQEIGWGTSYYIGRNLGEDNTEGRLF